jgi:stalled ribosome alternative rescue factor ArfA
MIGDKEMVQRSVIAKALADRKYRQRIVLAKKGKGSYNRKATKKETKNA